MASSDDDDNKSMVATLADLDLADLKIMSSPEDARKDCRHLHHSSSIPPSPSPSSSPDNGDDGDDQENLTKTPAELKVIIFKTLSSLKDVRSLAQVNRSFMTVYRQNEHVIFFGIASNLTCNTLGFCSPYILKLLMMFYEAKSTEYRDEAFPGDFFEIYGGRDPLVRSYYYNEGFLMHLPIMLLEVRNILTRMNQWSFLWPFKEKHRQLTHTENARVVRAMLALGAGMHLLQRHRERYSSYGALYKNLLRPYVIIFSKEEAIQMRAVADAIQFVKSEWMGIADIHQRLPRGRTLLTLLQGLLRAHASPKMHYAPPAFAHDSSSALRPETAPTLLNEVKRFYNPMDVIRGGFHRLPVMMDTERYEKLRERGPLWEEGDIARNRQLSTNPPKILDSDLAELVPRHMGGKYQGEYDPWLVPPFHEVLSGRYRPGLFK